MRQTSFIGSWWNHSNQTRYTKFCIERERKYRENGVALANEVEKCVKAMEDGEDVYQHLPRLDILSRFLGALSLQWFGFSVRVGLALVDPLAKRLVTDLRAELRQTKDSFNGIRQPA